MTRGAFVLGLIVAITLGALSFTEGVAPAAGTGTALAFGFLLLATIQMGHIFYALKLPRLTGHLICGAVFGPALFAALSPEMIADLALIKRVAVGLIALLAGCELNFQVLRPKLKSIGILAFFSFLAMALLLFGFFFTLSFFLPFTQEMTYFQRGMVALLCTNILCAFSPPVVMGILSETRASGPLSELSLSIVVIADLVIVILFSLSNFAASLAFPGVGQDAALMGLVIHIVASAGVGIAVGAVLALYIRRVGLRIGLIVFGVFFVVAEAGGVLHLDPLLVGLSAGLFLENVSPVSGHEVIKQTEPATLPTFAVFFAVIGAELNLNAFLEGLHFCIIAALIRAIALYIGSLSGNRFAKFDPTIARLAPLGMLSQAGVAIALANLLANSPFPWGSQIATLILGTIVVNQIVGPILFRVALARAGEVGQKHDGGTAEHAPHAPPEEISQEDWEAQPGT